MFGGQRTPVFLEWIRRGLALNESNGLLNLLNRFSPPGGDVIGIGPVAALHFLFRHFQAIATERGGFEFRQHIIGIVMFTVATKAQQAGDDHLRAMTATSRFNRPPEGFEAGSQIGSVYVLAIHSVAGGTIGQSAAG